MSDQAKFTAGRENGRKRPRGYADWRPQATTRVLLEQVDAVLEEHEAHLPLTVRQIFYRLVAVGNYPKTEQGYARLCEHLVRARRSKRIPFEVIRDDGITTYSEPCHAGTEDFWDHVGRQIKGYRRDRQEGQPQRIELWCEAAGMAPQLARVADGYSVPVFSSGGFASLSAVHDIARRALSRNVPTVLLHAGDFDPSGESIFDAIATDAAAFVEADKAVETLRLAPVRAALTPEQVRQHDLPTAPAKRSDTRSRGWEGGTCQLEALPPDQLAEIVESAIVAHLRPDRYFEQVEYEADDQAKLYRGLPA